jgi:hypothetical protein
MSKHKPSIEACLAKPPEYGPLEPRESHALIRADKAADSMMYWHERAMHAEAALETAYHELLMEEVDPDDCRTAVLKILRDAIHGAPK